MSIGIPRAREDLFAAHLLATTQFAAQSVELAHHGALAAAATALESLNRVAPREPAVLIATVLRQVVRERGLSTDAGRRLRALHNLAVVAGDDGAVPREAAIEAIADASSVVDAVDDWLTHSEFVTIARAAGRPLPRRRPG